MDYDSYVPGDKEILQQRLKPFADWSAELPDDESIKDRTFSRHSEPSGPGSTRGRPPSRRAESSRVRSRSGRSVHWKMPEEDETPEELRAPNCFHCLRNGQDQYVHVCWGLDHSGSRTKEMVVLCGRCLSDIAGMCWMGTERPLLLYCRHCRKKARFVDCKIFRRSSGYAGDDEVFFQPTGGSFSEHQFVQDTWFVCRDTVDII